VLIKRLIFLVAFPLSTHAATLPPILDLLPRCDYPVVATITASQNTTAWETELAQQNSALLRQVLLSFREQAAAQGADAVLIQDLSSSKSIIEGRTRRNSGAHYRLTIRYQIELINRCDEDQSLPLRDSAFNQHGQRIQGRFSQTATLNTVIELAVPEKSLPEVNTDIGLKQGFFGLHPGMTLQQVRQAFGAPTAFFTLTDGSNLLAYGRQHWLWFRDGKLALISQQLRPLSLRLSNLLAEDVRFDRVNTWRIEGQPAYRMSQASLQRLYPELAKNGDNQLLLPVAAGQFNFYLDGTLQTGRQLSAVSYAGSGGPHSLPALKQLAPMDLEQVLSLLAQPTPLDWPALLTVKPQLELNALQTDDGSTLYLLNPYLQLQVENQRLSAIQLYLSDPATQQQQAKAVLDALQLPATEADFLARYPDAFAAGDEVSWFGERQQIRLFFNSDGELTEAQLKLF
jgi:hypothetical protein